MYSENISNSNFSGFTESVARIGFNHGYRFDGDRVFLNASFEAAAESAHQHQWELQLRACRSQPQSAEGVARGHCIAAGALPPISELADAHETFGFWADARPPAGTGEWVMVLALAERSSGGSTVRHFVVFPNLERFQLPRMNGVAGFRVSEDGSAVTIWANTVENPRGFPNVSGTLSLELWALDSAYDEGDFEGVPLAGAVLGALWGGQAWHNVEYTLPFGAPPAGTWNLVMMLREWTGAGYTTRDFASFAIPYVVNAQESTPPVENRVEAPAVVEEAAPIENENRVEVEAAPTEQPAILEEAAATPVKLQLRPEPADETAANREEEAEDETVPVNTATVAMLKAIKGLTEPMARAILQARPFTSLAQLGKVKGIGSKTLKKIQDRLRLD